MSNYSQTVVGEGEYTTSKPTPTKSHPSASKGKVVSRPLDLENPYLSVSRPFFVPITEAKGGLLGALRELDDQLESAGRNRILSKKRPTSWIGKTVEPGQAGLYSHGGCASPILPNPLTPD
jgi:hypothetical protein